MGNRLAAAQQGLELRPLSARLSLPLESSREADRQSRRGSARPSRFLYAACSAGCPQAAAAWLSIWNSGAVSIARAADRAGLPRRRGSVAPPGSRSPARVRNASPPPPHRAASWLPHCRSSWASVACARAAIGKSPASDKSSRRRCRTARAGPHRQAPYAGATSAPAALQPRADAARLPMPARKVALTAATVSRATDSLAAVALSSPAPSLLSSSDTGSASDQRWACGRSCSRSRLRSFHRGGSAGPAGWAALPAAAFPARCTRGMTWLPASRAPPSAPHAAAIARCASMKAAAAVSRLAGCFERAAPRAGGSAAFAPAHLKRVHLRVLQSACE